MIAQIEEFGKTVLVSGFRDAEIGDVRVFLDSIRAKLQANVEVQVFDADTVASWRHLYFAALNALAAFKNGRNLSKSLAVETVLYASAQRQIKRAMERAGVKKTPSNVALIVVSENAETAKAALTKVSELLGSPDESVLELTPTKTENIKTVFDISYFEIGAATDGKSVQEALVDLVVENVALLATRL
jgi:tRNA threonylcarbamoyladenosine modification (KEOPS) complex Cgi121 subunit